MKDREKREEYTKLYMIFLSINITCLLVSNIIAIKTINILGLVFTVADIVFPITYILNDVFTEVYGFKKAKFAIWLSFICNILMVILFLFALALPKDISFNYQNEMKTVLTMTPRVLIASLIAFAVGNFTNSIVMSKLKVKTEGKYLAFRTITSTILGEAIDTLIFVPIVFLGSMESTSLIYMMLNMFCIKVILEIVMTPVTYKVIKYVKNKEGIDVYDRNEKYELI